MPTAPLQTVVRHLCRLVGRHDSSIVSDGELLGLFVRQRDEGAFEELIHRHGPMVLGVCRRVLGQAHDAEDAFQATFLVLVKRAGSVQPAERVGNWLYGVAYRTALEARTAALRRRTEEAKVMIPSQTPPDDGQAELLQLLDRELSRLPEKYRLPIVLCDLQGKTRKEVAGQLGWAEGTVASRLARGRNLLARRLSSLGKPVTVAALMTTLTVNATAHVPDSLAQTTLKVTMLVATGTAVTAVVPVSVAALVEGVSKMMLLSKVKVTTILFVGLLISLVGLGGFTQPTALGEPSAPAVVRSRQSQEGSRSVVADQKTADDEGEPINAIWISNPRVQKELRLTEGQIKKLTAVRVEVYRKHEADLKKANEEAWKHNYALYQEISRKIQTEERTAMQEAAPKILSAAALKRLRQIQRQARGLHHVVAQGYVQKKLKLDDEQVQKIEGFLKKGLEQARKEASKASTRRILEPLTFEEHIEREQKAYAEAMKGVLGVFSKEQQAIWKDLIGDAFAFQAVAAKEGQ